MKRISILLLALIFSLILTACGSAPQPGESPAAVAPTQETVTTSGNAEPATEEASISSGSINYAYENALSTRLLLALGTLKLSETSTPITAEQAPQLLLLWQALDNLTRSGTSAEVEVNALLSQIETTLSPEQIASINTMKLTQVELQSWVQTAGITVGTGTGLDGGTGQGMGQGQGQSLSPEARATKQAENGMTGTASNENGLSSAITSALIAYLESIK